jgi:Ca2+-binding RTX toxin-like protein
MRTRIGRAALVTAATALVMAGIQTAARPAISATPPPTCMGRTVTIMGTDGVDDLVGQSGVSDVIYGGKGNDRISGGDFYESDEIPGRAPDYICGGPGADDIEGGPGADHINGGDGNDEIDGSRGADVMRGNSGRDTVEDQSCDDCDRANDVLIGGDGADILSSGWGHDRLEGNAGRDQLHDEECQPSVLLGGPGDDYLESWTSSYEGYGAYTCSDHDYFTFVTADKVDGGRGTDSSQDDRDDSVSNVENVQIILHGIYD